MHTFSRTLDVSKGSARVCLPWDTRFIVVGGVVVLLILFWLEPVQSQVLIDDKAETYIDSGWKSRAEKSPLLRLRSLNAVTSLLCLLCANYAVG